MTLPISNPSQPPTPPTSEPVAPPAPAAAGTGAPGVDYEALYKQALTEAQEYKNRFTGLQGKYNQEQQKWQGDATKVTTLEQQLQEAIGQRSTFETQAKTTQETFNSTVGELNTLKAQHDRLNTIVGEFPELLPFLSVQQGDQRIDLLPQGSGDDLRTRLAAFAAQVKNLGAVAAAANLAGSTPPTPAPASTPSTDTLQQQMFAASKAGDVATYNKLYDQWLESKKAPAA